MSRILLRSLGLGATLVIATLSVAANKFDHAEYMKATATGQKKAEPAIKGSLSFEKEKKCVDFLDEKGNPAFSIRYDAVKTLLYEQAAKPRYTEAVLISPMFLLAHSKKHFLTIQYTDAQGSGQYVIVHLDKKNAQQAVAIAEAETGKKVERVEEK
jgi:hypothetical protein